jgi:hypothetical protein
MFSSHFVVNPSYRRMCGDVFWFDLGRFGVAMHPSKSPRGAPPGATKSAMATQLSSATWYGDDVLDDEPEPLRQHCDPRINAGQMVEISAELMRASSSC